VGWDKGNISFGGAFRFAKYGLQFRRKKGQSERGRGGRRGLGGGIPPRPSRSEAFPPFGIKPNIKAKQFSIPFKRKRVARKIKELKRKLFCFARRVSAGGNAGAGFQIIRAIFAQKRFELRSAIATNQDISNFQGKEFARSPRFQRGYARIFPCISELNRKVGQIQIQFFGKANGGSELRGNSQMKFVSNFFRFLPKAKIQSKFLIPRFWPKATNN
jgi:hypothetical protein